MYKAKRELVAAAVYALVHAASGRVVTLKTSSRKMLMPNAVTPDMCPALFIRQGLEPNERTPRVSGIPPKRTMKFEIFLYTADTPALQSVIPAQQLNFMVDAVEEALTPVSVDGRQTLDGLVAHAWIDGGIEYYEGISDDGKSAAIVPVTVLLP